MAYCTPDDVQSEFKAAEGVTFDDTTFVKKSTVLAWIAQADALINSYLGARYIIPVLAPTNPEVGAMLQMFSTVLVADRVRSVRNVNQVVQTSANQNPNGITKIDVQAVIKMLKDIRDGVTPLAGAIAVAAVTGGVNSWATSNCSQPVFRKDERQW